MKIIFGDKRINLKINMKKWKKKSTIQTTKISNVPSNTTQK